MQTEKELCKKLKVRPGNANMGHFVPVDHLTVISQCPPVGQVSFLGH